jgi:hypothetical protein
VIVPRNVIAYSSIPILILSEGLISSTIAKSQTSNDCAAILKMDCTSKRDCSTPRDTRECSKCLTSIFNHCSVRGKDPECEAAKAAQNVLYTSQQAACEQEKAKEEADCNASKSKLLSAWQACAKQQ